VTDYDRDIPEYPIAPPAPRKGRGAVTNLQGRYEVDQREAVDDGWIAPSEEESGRPALRTQVFEERAKSILTHNQSPDIPFSVSLNPYRGCEHVMRHCFLFTDCSTLGFGLKNF
jgi:hypothetical protein